MNRLNIGCGNVPLDGWINVDKFYYPGSPYSLTDQRVVKDWVDTDDSQGFTLITECHCVLLVVDDSDIGADAVGASDELPRHSRHERVRHVDFVNERS